MAASNDLIKHSVTRADYERDVLAGQTMHVFLGDLNALNHVGARAGLPAYWSPARDRVLTSTMHMCSIWPSAVNKAITKAVALGWRIEDSNESQRRQQHAQDLLLWADASDWITFGARHLQDVYLTDNGGFIEVVRSSNARGARIIGLMHLDSLRCTRTGHPEYPVLYCDDYGVEHALRRDQVLFYADTPSPRAMMYGVGQCAADRAFDAIVKLAAIETYFREKVTGSRTLAIHVVSGLSKDKLKSALDSADQDQQDRGFMVYKGSVVVPTLNPEVTPSVVTIPLAEIPDGFDAQQERDAAYLEIVNALGIALQDIKPLSGQGLGTGTQSVILDEAAEGMGPGAAWRKWFEHAMTWKVLAQTTTFAFATNDIRDQKAKAEVAKIRADTRKTQVESGEITAQQALNIAVDVGDAPREFLPRDETEGAVVTDNEKAIPATDLAPNPTPQPVAVVPQAKASRREVRTLIDEQLRNALNLVAEVLDHAPRA